MLQPEKHICSRCSHIPGEGVFDSEEAYLSHKCKKTGCKPTQPEHLGKEFESASKAALKRGEARSK